MDPIHCLKQEEATWILLCSVKKAKGGKIDGLYMALDADAVEVPETDKVKF